MSQSERPVIFAAIPYEVPILAGPKKVDYSWEYRGVSYSLSLVLHKSVYDFYDEIFWKRGLRRKDQKLGFHKGFLDIAAGDKSIAEIIGTMKEIALRFNFSRDQLLELSFAFVQSLPYDFAKAKFLDALRRQNIKVIDQAAVDQAKVARPRYPYQILYDRTGVCSEKSYLAAVLAKELGYGIALFDFHDHMALGVKCRKQYSSFHSGFCFLETTGTGFGIGEVPYLNISTGQVEKRRAIGPEGDFPGGDYLQYLTDPVIYQMSSGKSYKGIRSAIAMERKLQDLEKGLKALDGEIISLEEEDERLKSRVPGYLQEILGTLNTCLRTNGAVPPHLDKKTIKEIRKIDKKHDAIAKALERKTTAYNNMVSEHNHLLMNHYR